MVSPERQSSETLDEDDALRIRGAVEVFMSLGAQKFKNLGQLEGIFVAHKLPKNTLKLCLDKLRQVGLIEEFRPDVYRLTPKGERVSEGIIAHIDELGTPEVSIIGYDNGIYMSVERNIESIVARALTNWVEMDDSQTPQT